MLQQGRTIISKRVGCTPLNLTFNFSIYTWLAKIPSGNLVIFFLNYKTKNSKYIQPWSLFYAGYQTVIHLGHHS